MEKPLVSICCLVYNHESFLRECFEGFVMQKTTFPIEVLVHDDASTDHSADIIREYTAKYPDIFKPIYQTENQYSKGVPISATYQFPRAKGKYIAMCEGDDYWIDPLKLQKQVDFLESHDDYSLCFHDVLVYKQNEGTLVKDWIVNNSPDELTIEELIQNSCLHTCAILFRNNPYVISAYKSIGHVVLGDYILWFLNAQYGKLKNIHEAMAVYRYGVGIWSANKNVIEKYLNKIISKAKLSVVANSEYKDLCERDLYTVVDFLTHQYNKLEKEKNEILNSKTYRLGNLIATPFRYINEFFNNVR